MSPASTQHILHFTSKTQTALDFYTMTDIANTDVGERVSNAFDKARQNFIKKVGDPSATVEMQSVSSAGKLHIDDMGAIQQNMAKKGSLRHMGRIARFLDILGTYSATVEVFVQVKPEVLALVWGPVKLLLVWASEYGQLFDTIAGTMERVGFIVPQFQALESTFSDRAELGEALVLFFENLLDFYHLLIGLARKSSKGTP